MRFYLCQDFSEQTFFVRFFWTSNSCKNHLIGQAILNVILEIGADTLQATDGYRLLVHPAATTGRLAGAIADASQNARKDIGAPVDHVGIRVAAGSNQSDVLGNGGVSRTGPLTIHDFMKVVVCADVRRFHVRSVSSYLGCINNGACGAGFVSGVHFIIV